MSFDRLFCHANPLAGGEKNEQGSTKSVHLWHLPDPVGVVPADRSQYVDYVLWASSSERRMGIRVVGMLLVLLAYYDIQAARKNLIDFFRWSVFARGTVIVFFAVFVLLDLVKPILLLFGAVDLLAAVWTHLALRKETGS